jgi:hypothetical protein
MIFLDVSWKFVEMRGAVHGGERWRRSGRISMASRGGRGVPCFLHLASPPPDEDRRVTGPLQAFVPRVDSGSWLWWSPLGGGFCRHGRTHG